MSSSASANTQKLQSMKLSELRPAPGTKVDPKIASSGTTHLFYHNHDGTKTSLGTFDDRIKLIHFSGVAHDQIVRFETNPDKVKAAGSTREVNFFSVDLDAGRIVLDYINNNNIHNPLPLSLNLLPARAPFAISCKVHHACNTFRIVRAARGEQLRDHIARHIRHTKAATFLDFKLACDWLFFDTGLMKLMLQKVAYHTLKEWIDQHELGRMWRYCTQSDRTKGSNLVERLNVVFAELERQEREKAAGDATVVHKSVAGAPVDLTSSPQKGAVAAAGAQAASSPASSKGEGVEAKEASGGKSSASKISYAKVLSS